MNFSKMRLESRALTDAIYLAFAPSSVQVLFVKKFLTTTISLKTWQKVFRGDKETVEVKMVSK